MAQSRDAIGWPILAHGAVWSEREHAGAVVVGVAAVNAVVRDALMLTRSAARISM